MESGRTSVSVRKNDALTHMMLGTFRRTAAPLSSGTAGTSVPAKYPLMRNPY